MRSEGSPPPAGTVPSVASGSVSLGCARRDRVARTLAPPRSMAVLAALIAPGAGVGAVVGPCGGIEQVTVRAEPRARMCEEAA